MKSSGKRRDSPRPRPAPASTRASTSARASRPLILGVIGALVTVTVLLYGPVRTFEFVEWDDPTNVARNLHLRLPLPEAVGHFWTHLYFGSYIPVTRTLWALLWKVAPDPGAFHLVNLAVHLANVLLAFVLLRRLGIAVLGAGAGAFLFAVHPVQVEAVAWVTGMKDLLGVFWSLLALIISIGYLRPPSLGPDGARGRVAFALASTCYLCALLSKAAAATLPLVVLLLGIRLGCSFRRMLPLLALWAVLAVPVGIATRIAEAQASIPIDVPIASRLLVMADAFGFYLVKLVAPFGLCPDYGRTPIAVMGNPAWYGFALVPVTVALLLFWRRKNPWLPAAGMVFAVSILPVSGLVPFVYQNTSTVADRYLYLALLGPVIALAHWVGAAKRGRVAIVLIGVALLALAVQSSRQLRHWRNTRELFEHTLEVNPNSAIAHNNLGLILARQGRIDDAIRRFRAALRLQPGQSDAHGNLGFALYLKGHPDSAIAESRAAVRAFPMGAQARLNLGLLLSQFGDRDEAALHLREALRLSPLDSTARAALERLKSRPARGATADSGRAGTP